MNDTEKVDAIQAILLRVYEKDEVNEDYLHGLIDAALAIIEL